MVAEGSLSFVQRMGWQVSRPVVKPRKHPNKDWRIGLPQPGKKGMQQTATISSMVLPLRKVFVRMGTAAAMATGRRQLQLAL